MGMDDEQTWLTYAAAAKRVRSSTQTIHRWRRAGMVMEWRTDEIGQRYRVVALDVLLAWWRQTMQSSPVHFYRMRQKAIDRGETPPPLPERFKRRPRADSPTLAQKATVGDLTASNAPPVPESKDGSLGHAEAFADVLRELPEFIGQAEHAALIRAMEDQPPACDGLEVFTRDRFDDPEEVEMMRGICRDCPLLELCETFAAVGKPSAGMWAGMTPSEVRRLDTSRAA